MQEVARKRSGSGQEVAQEVAHTVEVIEDDWREATVAHRVLSHEWHGETQFEVSTGEWKSYVHFGWRNALMTPKRVKALELDEGTRWTGKRGTVVRAYKK